jgi:hypothetical protein
MSLANVFYLKIVARGEDDDSWIALNQETKLWQKQKDVVLRSRLVFKKQKYCSTVDAL